MLRSKTLPIVLLPLALTACGASRSPVPLVGPSADVGALTGEWSGDYSSAESGRAGSIKFTLRAAGDSAFGDVVMVPSATGVPLTPWHSTDAPGAQPTGASQAPQSTVLKIRFVQVEQARSEEHT